MLDWQSESGAITKGERLSMTNPNTNKPATQIELPTAELVQKELASAKSIDDFFGREGIFARLFARTLEQMLEAELTSELG